MKFKKSLLMLFVLVSLCLYNYVAYCDDTLDGVWRLSTETLKGNSKGDKGTYNVNITHDIVSGRIDGKTLDDLQNPLGRVSGLTKRTLVEMTFSYQRNVLRCTLQLSDDGTLMGGIYKTMDGSSGVIYGLKKEQSKDKKTDETKKSIPVLPVVEPNNN